MANHVNKTLLNFVSGEWSPLMAGRTDLAGFEKSLAWCQNFIVLPQGGFTYRPGNYLVGLTKNNANAIMIPFQFSASDAIVIVATNQKFRFERNNAAILNTPVNISGISLANPAVVTATAHGFTNGQEVYITGVMGTSQVNGRFFLVAAAATNTFQLQDQFGNNVDSTLYTAWSSGGTVASIYELTTPYFTQDLPSLRYAQIGDVMYIDCRNATTGASYAPQKLIRSGFTNWSLATYSRTIDPFTPLVVSPTAITQATPAQVTVASTAGMVNGDVIYAAGIGGMTQLNGNFYILQNLTGTTFTLTDLTGVAVNSTGFTAFTSGGTFTECNQWPGAVSFSGDGRLVHISTAQNPEGYWASELPVGTTTNYDNFTTGTASTFGIIFNFAPVDGIVDNLVELKQFGDQFTLLGASSIRQLYGATPNTPPTPTVVNTQTTIQGAAKVSPLVINWNLLFVDVNGKKLRGLQYNLAFSDYEAIDYNLAADHLGEESPFIKIIRVKGIPDVVWVLRADGVLLSFTFNNIENIAGWARHYIGGNGKVLDICSIRNSSGNDQLWMVVQRVLNGQTYTSVEVSSEYPNFPLRRKYYSGEANQLLDELNWESATWEALKDPCFLDGGLNYDGRLRGSSAAATLTLSATTGNITITSNNAVFQASDVGSQIWKTYAVDGSGGGQAVITGFTSSIQVTATVKTNFDNLNTLAPNLWEFAVTQITNLQLYNGVTMGVQADGGYHPPQLVTAGAINLQFYAARVHVGFPYVGFVCTQNLDVGGRTGPANSKPRNLKQIKIRFKDTIGCQVGSTEYNATTIIFRQAGQIMNRVPPPYTGTQEISLIDKWNSSIKQVVVLQTDPTPCTVTAIDPGVQTSEPP